MSKKSESKNIQKSSYRRLFRVLLFLILGLLVLLIITSGIFYSNKDKIAENILLSVNKKQEGELRFRDITFNPFVQFPSISIQLNDVQYFEIKEHSINASFKVGVDTLENNNDSLNPNFKVGIDSILGIGKPIAEFQYLYGAIDILELIKGDIDISKVLLKNGDINIVKYPDSTFNFTNAIASTQIDPENDTSHIDSEDKDLRLLLDKISLDNVQIAYYDSVENDLSIIQINALKASLEYLPDLINTDVDVQLQLVEFGIARKLRIKDKTISITSFLNYNRTNDVLKILTGTFGFEEAIFNFSGMIDFKDKGYIDMEIDGSDRDFGFSKLFLSETGLNQIKNGNIYFNGIVKGKLTEGIPVFDFSFGIEDVDVNIPSVNSEITKINLAGQFNSGIVSDFSQAKLSVKNLTAQLPGGYLNANCTIENFVTPDFTLDWDMKADVTGFEDIFRLEFIDSLGGHVSIKDHLIAKYDPSSKWIVSEESYTLIQCDSLVFNIPGVLNVSELSGAIIGDNDTLRLENLKIQTGNTDLMIDGEVYNLISLFLSNDQNITSNLSIQSNIFDLAELLAYDPRVGENFPYQIVEIDLLLHTITSATQLTDFYSIPEINFEIRHLDAIIQDFLPPISISKGSFKLHEREERLLMNFNEFDIEMAGADINADVEYYSPSILPDYVNTKTKISGLIPGKLFYDESADSIPEALSGILNGSLICELTLSIDTNIFDKILVYQGDFIYETSTDTISINSLFLEAENVIYDLDTNDNPLATLSSQCIIKAQEVNIDILELKNIQYELDIQNGEYFITPQGVSLFGVEGQGTYFLRPFTEVPSYRLKYAVEQFHIGDLLSSVNQDTIITGLADFNMNITIEESPLDNTRSKISGDLYLGGNNLTLYGLDADKFIEKLKRSQNFNLVDVAAVVVVGPYALFVSKGSDYARILLANPGEKTHIQSLISEWNIVDSRLTIEDVAFSTEKNRLAAKGWIDINSDSLNLIVAALNKKGCSIMNQELFGSLDNPELRELHVVESVIAPVTNLAKDAFGVHCKVFYEGEVKHPVKQKKQ